jgi:tripartite-type tricarboxylate transporter receptor subunit TctC
VIVCRWRACLALVGLALLATDISPALAQAKHPTKYPTRPIRIVSPFAAGSVSDISLRLFADKLAARLRGQIVIDNQPRAGGVTAAAAVLASPPDGYTLALFSTSTAISVSLFKQLPYDPVRDFAPVSTVSTFANVLATGAQSKYATLAEVIAAARGKPGALNIGTTTVGSTNHLAATLFKALLALDVVIVPYRTPGDLLTAAIRNDVDVIVQSYGALKTALEDKQLRALATTTPGRAAYLPEVPSVQEAAAKDFGVKDFDVVTWNGFFVPAKTPPDVIALLNAATRSVLQDPEIARRFLDLGLEPLPSTREELGTRMASEVARWARVIEEAGIEKQ